MAKKNRSTPSLEQLERLLYALHNWGYGYEGGKRGEEWDAGAQAALDHLFSRSKTKAFRRGYQRALALYRECHDEPAAYIEQRIQRGLSG